MDQTEEMLSAIAELEERANLKSGFYSGLLTEDDWSFVIKIHALYEAAVSHLLVYAIGKNELESYISRLELGDKSRGKLRLVKDLGLLDEQERKFIYALSEIRNDFVHKVANTCVGLEDYLQSLDEHKRKNYHRTFGYTYTETLHIAGHTVDSRVFTRENPRIAIWHNSMHVLAVISMITATEKSKLSIQKSIQRIHDLQNR